MRSPLDVHRLAAGLAEGDGWAPPVVLAQVGSTNAEARRRGRLHEPVLTELQLAGRGRLGRAWSEVPSAGLAMSVLLERVRPDGWLPLATGLAVRDALTDLGAEAVLKWPNDVQLVADDLRKVCGILCELDLERGASVVGVGINVDHSREELPVDRATSLRLVGVDADRTDLAVAVLSRLRSRHADLRAGGAAAARTRADYLAACSTIGREVMVHLPDGRRERHEVTGIDADGSLRVRGRSDSLSAGDVQHIRPAQPPGSTA